MAQFSVTRQNYYPTKQNADIAEMMIPTDQYGFPAGPQGMGASSSHSAFGEPISVPITPVFQLDALYGLDPNKFETYSATGGSVDNNGPLMECSTGTSVGGYGVIRSRRTVRYRPGQGAMTRFTAAFTQGVAGYTQRAGFFTQEQALQVGYNGTEFGVLRQNGGKAVIYRLTITQAAGGSENVTVTLNGTAFVVPVTATTIAANATTLGNASYSGWIVEYNGTYINFLSESVGPMAGAFSVSSSGSLTGTMTQLQAGVAHTTTWTPQSQFTMDKLDGTGPSKMVLDPTKLNVYQIHFRWLGVGEITFAIENEGNGDMISFHHEHYTNKNTVPHLDNPSMKVGYVAASLGGSGTDVVVKGASCMGAIEGVIAPTSYPDSISASRSSLNSGGTYYHMLSLHNRRILNNKINAREVLLRSITAGAVSAASTPIRVLLYKNAAFASNLQYTVYNESWSSVFYSDTQTTLNPASYKPIYQFLLSPGAAETRDISYARIVLAPGDHVHVVIVGSGVISQADVALNWLDD